MATQAPTKPAPSPKPAVVPAKPSSPGRTAPHPRPGTAPKPTFDPKD
jgi:hypothetical protein